MIFTKPTAPMRPVATALLIPVLLAFPPRTAAASPAHAAAVVMSAAADTAFKPEGAYALNLTVEGAPIVMSFTVEKKPDGSYTGVFRHSEMGDFASTSFKVEGRKLTVTVETPGGPATVVLTVATDNAVEGEWTMMGDGSKIAGKKTS